MEMFPQVTVNSIVGEARSYVLSKNIAPVRRKSG